MSIRSCGTMAPLVHYIQYFLSNYQLTVFSSPEDTGHGAKCTTESSRDVHECVLNPYKVEAGSYRLCCSRLNITVTLFFVVVVYFAECVML